MLKTLGFLDAVAKRTEGQTQVTIGAGELMLIRQLRDDYDRLLAESRSQDAELDHLRAATGEEVAKWIKRAEAAESALGAAKKRAISVPRGLAVAVIAHLNEACHCPGQVCPLQRRLSALLRSEEDSAPATSGCNHKFERAENSHRCIHCGVWLKRSAPAGKAEPEAAPMNCPQCRGTGWKEVRGFAGATNVDFCDHEEMALTSVPCACGETPHDDRCAEWTRKYAPRSFPRRELKCHACGITGTVDQMEEDMGKAVCADEVACMARMESKS